MSYDLGRVVSSWEKTASGVQMRLTQIMFLCLGIFVATWAALKWLGATDIELLCAFIAISTIFCVIVIGWIVLALTVLLGGINMTIDNAAHLLTDNIANDAQTKSGMA